MKERSEDDHRLEELRQSIIGLGERSQRKSYYPQLQDRIRELERANRALAESEEKYRTLVENVNVGIFRTLIDSDKTMIQANPAMARILGYRNASELIGDTPLVHYLDPLDREELMGALQREGSIKDRRVVMRKRDGTPITASLTMNLFRGPDGSAEFIDGVLMDITEQVAAEKALRESEARYRFISDAAFEGIVIHVDEIVVDANEAFKRMVGREDSEILGRPIYDFLEPGSREVTKKAIEQGTTEPYEARLERRDGSFITVSIRGRYFDYKGRVARVATLQDITELREAEEVIRRSEMLLREVITNLPAVLWTTDNAGTFTLSEGRGLHRLGLGPGEAVGRSTLDMYREFPIILDGIKRALSGVENSWQVDVGGTVFQSWATPLRDRRGRITGMLGVSADITELVEAKRWVEEERARLRAILDTLPVGIIIADPTGRLLEVNGIAKGMWENWYWTVGGSEPGGARSSRSTAERRVDAKELIMARTTRGETIINEELDIEGSDGGRGAVLASGAPVRNSTGEMIGVIITAVDITQRKELEKDLAEAKLNAETYIDVMTHDITNYNTAAMGYLQLAETRLNLEEKDRKLITRPLEELRNSSELIANIWDIRNVESGTEKMEQVDLRPMLDEVVSENINVPGRSVTASVSGPEHATVIASGLVKTVFSNIICNSVVHSSGPVHIDVTVAEDVSDGSDNVLVSVADNGPGVPDEFKDRLFNRTLRGLTKPVGRGLGLYLVKRLVEEYHGRVWVEDRVPGDHTKGARFVVMLPSAGRSGEPLT